MGKLKRVQVVYDWNKKVVENASKVEEYDVPNRDGTKILADEKCSLIQVIKA